MDPLTAFSLTCGIIQVVDFSAKSLSKCREIYTEGSLAEHQELKHLTKHLVDVRAELDLSKTNMNPKNLVTPDEQTLLEIAEQCSKTADQLVKKLDSLKVEGQHKKRQAIRKTFNLLWEKGEMKEIQKRLDGYRSALDTQILINLRQRLNLTSLQDSKDFQRLDKNVQTFIHSLSQGSKFEELKDLIRNENETLREQQKSIFQEYERRQEEMEYRTQLLESLCFAEIHVREETIKEAHSKTFQWIFDKSGQAVRPWDNFSAWLENGEGIYWIKGKAGSGKSTLMSFLCQDKRTIEALTVWSETKAVLMPKFYLWSNGTTMQKSFEGLLRSLLWQILKESPNTTVLPDTFGSLATHSRSASLEYGLIGAWTRRRLQRTLQDAISQLQSSYRLCLFIDGLDEFDEDDDELITFVRDIVSKTSVKVCLSSRPEKVFEDAFGSCAKLRLQDLTHNDIQRFVRDKFHDVPQSALMTSENGYEMNQITEEIVTRAEGVFLWVELAVRDQIIGLRNEDSPEQLSKRLLRLPNKVEGIYLQMLHEIEPLYRQEAARFLQIALHDPRFSLLGHALGSYEELEKMLLSDHTVSMQKIASLCQSTRRRIITRCAGLLEIHDPSNQDTMSKTVSDWDVELDSPQLNATPSDGMLNSDFKRELLDDSSPEKEKQLQNPKPETHGRSSGSEPEITDDELLKLQIFTHVNFVHRTAVDFLIDTEPGKKFLDDNLSPDFDIQVFHIKASLGKLRLLGPMNYPDNDHNELSLGRIDRIMEMIANLEFQTGRPQTRLCELVDGTMSISDRLHSKWSPNSHWCMRWGRLARAYSGEEGYTTLRSRSSSTDSFDSSTTDSFHSTRSEFSTFDHANPAPTDSVGFLGFVASYNLVHYVQQMLDCREKSVSAETLDNLLRCSILVYQPYEWRFGLPDSAGPLKVVLELLRRGANPNAKLFAKTIWRYFLERVAALWSTYFLNGFDLERAKAWIPNSQTLTSSIVAFIENRADMGAIWTFHFPIYSLPSEYSYLNNKFNMQLSALSALSAIKVVLGHSPDFPRIQEMCIARGAVLYSRCTILEVEFEDSTEESLRSFYVRQYELSERESEEFLAIFEQFVALCTSKIGDLKDFRCRLRDFSERLHAIRPEASDSSHMRTSIARYSEMGSEWYTHKSFSDPKTFQMRLVKGHRRQKGFYDALSSPTQSPDWSRAS